MPNVTRRRLGSSASVKPCNSNHSIIVIGVIVIIVIVVIIVIIVIVVIVVIIVIIVIILIIVILGRARQGEKRLRILARRLGSSGRAGGAFTGSPP